MPTVLTSIVALIGAGIAGVGIFTGLAAIINVVNLLNLMMQPNTFGQLNAEMQSVALYAIVFVAVTAALFKVGRDIIEAA